MWRDVLLFTGFPGFIGKRLLARLAISHPFEKIYLLVESRFRLLAEKAIRTLRYWGEIEILEGDITQDNLGLPVWDLERLQEEVTHIYHLAAKYDLRTDYDSAYQVNVVGTANLISLAEGCANLLKFVYFSTAYVSGDRTGRVREEELDVGQRFKNHYEQTKFLAEKLVREKAREIKAVIVRPGIVVGDSHTGETDKFDGPYYVLRFLYRFPHWFPLPYFGRGKAPVNLVPVDFVVNAAAVLIDIFDNEGKTYHLTDPRPRTAKELYRLFTQKLGRVRPIGMVPLALLKAALSLPPIERVTGIPRQVLPYFEIGAEYDTTNAAKDLGPLGLFPPPPIEDYIDNLVRYFIEHAHDRDKIRFP